MTSDKELVEVWKKQFEEWTHDFPGDPLSKVYLEFAWMEAKRSQPSVVLPEPNSCYDMVLDHHEKVCEQLTAAGIKYTIGE